MAFDDDGDRSQLIPETGTERTAIDTIVVPRGAEEGAVRKGLRRARSGVRVVTTGIGPQAAALAAERAGPGKPPGRILVTGLCGLLSPAFLVGDALVYRDVRRGDEPPLELDRALTEALAARLPGAQTGVHGVESEAIVTSARAKSALGRDRRAEAVDMESYALASTLVRAGARVAVVRIGSDAVGDDLPDLGRAFDTAGGLDGRALALAMLRRPLAGVRLVRNGARALAALERAIERIALQPCAVDA